MRRLLVLIACALALYSLWAALLFSQQRRMLFAAWSARVGLEPPAVQGEVRSWLDVGGDRVETWLLPPMQAPSRPYPVLLFAHGNGEVIDQWPDALHEFRDLGLGVLLVEYPGYGRSGGAPTQDSVRETFLAAYDQLARNLDVDAQRIVGFGRSLGGGAVCQLSRERPLAALVLLSTFSSTRIFAARYFLPSFLVRDPFDNVDALRSYAGPVLVLHGLRDQLIPFSNGTQLASAAHGATLRAYDCGHECWGVAEARIETDVSAFLRDRHLLAPAGDAAGR